MLLKDFFEEIYYYMVYDSISSYCHRNLFPGIDSSSIIVYGLDEQPYFFVIWQIIFPTMFIRIFQQLLLYIHTRCNVYYTVS